MNNSEFKQRLESRTKKFSVELIRFLKSMPFDHIDSVISKQILRSGTSIGANYREANRAESRKDFVHKIGIVEKEASETLYWIEIIQETWEMTDPQKLKFDEILQEATEFLALFVTISKNSKK